MERGDGVCWQGWGFAARLAAMKRLLSLLSLVVVLTAFLAPVVFSIAKDPKTEPAKDAEPRVPDPEFVDLFNGVDLTGWVDVNTTPETWTVRDGLLVCSGRPTGVMRSREQYENFILIIEWRHMEPGGNSGVFLWSDAIADREDPLPNGMEVQMLELDYVKLHRHKDGTFPPVAYVHGELFGAGSLTGIPDNPRGKRSKSLENRCKPRGQWNRYMVVAVDGTVKLSVNGKFVNGIRESSVRKGYLCLESEGGEIHFRKIRLMKLPDGMANETNTAKLIGANQK